MISFNSLTLRNFLSVGDVPLVIKYSGGVHYVTGRDNTTGSRNGVGKTALFADGIMFALFGKSLRKTKLWKLINTKNGQDCIVTLDFVSGGKPYQIMRGLNPHFLKFVQPDGAEIELGYKKETQELINDVIKLDFNTCKNMVVMSINRSRHFMGMNKYEKRIFIEQILSIDVIGTMYKIITTEYNDIKSDIKNLEGQHAILKKHYNDTKKQNEKIQKELEEFESKKKKKVDECKENIADDKKKLGELVNIRVESDQIVVEVNELRQKQMLLREKIKEHEGSMNINKKSLKSYDKRITLLKESECYECESTITPEHRSKKTTEIHAKIEKVTKNDAKHGIFIEKADSLLNPVRIKIENLEASYQKAINIANEIKNIEAAIEMKLVNLETMETSSISPPKIDTSKIEKDFKDVRKNLDKQSGSFKYVSLLKAVFSDEGIKSYIIRQVLPILNSKLNEYLSRLNSSYFVKFDESFEEIITSPSGRKMLPYSNFSAGEQRRVDLALLLTFIDIARMQGRTTVNLLVLDELIDSALDSDGIEAFMQIIREKTDQEDLAIYVISHRKDYTADIYDSIIILEKNQGFTKIKAIF